MSYSEKKAINIKRHIAPLASRCPTNVCDSKAVKLELSHPSVGVGPLRWVGCEKFL